MGEREWGKGEREKKRKFKKQKGGEEKERENRSLLSYLMLNVVSGKQ